MTRFSAINSLRPSSLHFFRAGWRNSNPIGLSKQSNLVLSIMMANSLTETCSPNFRIFCVPEIPQLFTLGSTAVHHPGGFYTSSIEAAGRLGCRAVLVGVSGAAGIIAPNIFGLPYAPYSRVFARSSVIVHQGGSGTTGQALRAGRPMIVVPFGWDQPDNAARVERLGLGLAVSREAYSSTAASAIHRVLTEPAFAARAAEIGERVRREDALTIACNAIERLLE